jgi:hypothetical protein
MTRKKIAEIAVFHAGLFFFLDSFFDPDDGCDIFL